MKVTLLNNPTLNFVDSGVGMCWDKGSYGADTDKGKERIDRVCNKFQHSSMLRFVNYVFEIEECPKWLFETFRDSSFIVIDGNYKHFRLKASAQALKDLDLESHIIQLLIPKEHWFVFEITEDEIFKIYDKAPSYMVNQNGEVISVKRQSKYDNYKPVLMKGSLDLYGYMFYNLKNNGIPIYKSEHRLVAETFITNPQNKPQVNHIDGNKQNNHSSNLEWCTYSENEQHSYTTLGKTIHNKCYLEQYSLDGNIIKIWNSLTDAINSFRANGESFNTKLLLKHFKGELDTFKGFRWIKKEYKNEC